MRRIRRWGAFGFVCGVVGFSGWDASAAPAGRGAGFAARGSFGAPTPVARGFRPLRQAAFGRHASGGITANGSGAYHGSGWRTGGFGGRDQVFAGGFWPGFGDGDPYGFAVPVVIVRPRRDLGDPTVLDLPAVPGIREAPAPEPAGLTIDRDEWRGPRRTGAKILSRGRDGHFSIVEGSGEASRGATDPRIIHIPARQRR